MPIINGTYVPDTLGSAKDVQQQVFGDYTRKDMSDYSTAAYNYLMKQQEQAYNLELWKLTNEYNSPASQMQRFQDAGLNPNLIYSQQNTAQSPASASASSFRPVGMMSKHQQNQIATINQIQGLIKSARETYDYLKYGRETSAWNLKKVQEDALAQHLQNEWNETLLIGPSEDETTRSYAIGKGPRYSLYKTQSDTAQKQYERMKFLVSNLLPTQEARMKALTALDNYQLDFMKGKYSAVLDLDLGLGDTVNQWARLLILISLAQMF